MYFLPCLIPHSLFFFALLEILGRISSASANSEFIHVKRLTPRQTTTDNNFPSTCRAICLPLIDAIPCGQVVSTCTCNIQIAQAIEPCQQCLNEEQRHENAESAIGSIGGSGASNTPTTSLPTLESVSSYEQKCANAGFPLTGNQLSTSQQGSNQGSVSPGQTTNIGSGSITNPSLGSASNGNGISNHNPNAPKLSNIALKKTSFGRVTWATNLIILLVIVA